MTAETAVNEAARDVPDKFMEKQKRWMFFPSISYKRLERYLPILHQEHSYLESLSVPKNQDATKNKPGEGQGNWRDCSNALLKEADDSLNRNDSQRGWTCFKGAARYHLYGMEERKPELLTARARSILREANDKLKGWRKETIQDLLANENGKLEENLSADRVARAAQILDDHFDNIYHKLELQQQRLLYLILATLILVVGWILIAPYIIPLPSQIGLNARIFWVAVACLGSMGAVLSAFSSASKGLSDTRIPDALAEWTVTSSRIAFATITAIIAVFLLVSGVINLGAEYTKLIWVLAIGAGFSERLVVASLENMAKPGNKA